MDEGKMSDAINTLDAARAIAVDSGNYPMAIEIQKIINSHSGPKEPTITSEAMDWVDSLMRRLDTRITDLAFLLVKTNGTNRVTVEEVKQAAGVVLGSGSGLPVA